MKFNIGFLLALGVFFSGALHVGTALADEKDKALTLPEVTVTSQKYSEDVQSISASVSVFEEETIKDLGLKNSIDLAHLTPGIDYIKPDNQTVTFTFRGIGGTTNMNKVYSVNVDGVTIPYVAPNLFLDVERIEVLRGSQGSLYGRNTLGGLVSVTHNEPTETVEGNAGISYGSYRTGQADGVVNMVFSEKTAARVAMSYSRTDSYFENTFLDKDDSNSNDKLSALATIQTQISPDNKLKLTLIADEFDGGMDNHVKYGKSGYETTFNEPGYNKGDVFAPILTWEKQFGELNFTSITNYTSSNYGFLFDVDYGRFDINTMKFDEHTGSFSQEFRLNGETGEGAKWLAGLYFLSEENDTETIFSFGADAGPWAGVNMSQESTIDTTNAALFGQFVYPWKAFEVTAQMRFDYEEKQLDWEGSVNGTPSANKEFTEHWFGLMPSLSVAWLPTDNDRVYVSISRGYKAGDFNNVQVDPQVVTKPVDPEYSLTYELGYKGRFAEDRAEFNAALFYIDWKDLQVETPHPSAVNANIKQNAAQAHSFGIEADGKVRIASGWDAFANANYLFEYEFDKFENSTHGDLSGKKVPTTSKYSFTLGSIYRHATGFFLSSTFSLYGPKYWDENNEFEQKSYSLLNAKVGYEQESWSAYLYGTNLLNEEYSCGYYTGAEMPAEPMVLGVRLEGRF